MFKAISKRSIYAGAAAAGIAGAGVFASRRSFFADAEQKPALNPADFVPFKLQEVQSLTHNVKLYRFALPEKDQTLGTFVASALVVKANINGKDVFRPYTPTSSPDAKGHFDLMVKIYEQGVMSKHIDNLKIGEELLVKGPIPKYKYAPNTKKRIYMLAGGTGITPMYQVIKAVLSNPADKTELFLLYGNLTPADIMLKQELDSLAAKHSKQFHISYTVDKASSGWKGETGYVTADMVKKAFGNQFDANDEQNQIVFVCGPPPMMKALSGEKKSPAEQGELSGLLKTMGCNEKNVYKF